MLFGAEQREPAVRPQQPGGLAERNFGIDPVERGTGDDQGEGRTGGGQVLERRDPKADSRAGQAPPGSGDHGPADVDGGHAEPRACQSLGELAGPAADLQDRSPAAEPSGRGHELQDVRRVPGTERLIPFGDAVE
jgi:hypothetical protein